MADASSSPPSPSPAASSSASSSAAAASSASPAPALGQAQGTFASLDGLVLHRQWRQAASPEAVAVVVHGYAEHGGRYGHVMEALAAARVSSLAFDVRGHGRSPGPRGHCDRFDDYVGDLVRALISARAELGERPMFIVGHSHGALITLRALCEPGALPSYVRGASLSAPYLGLALEVPAVKVWAARAASRLWPRLALPNGLRAEDLTHDEEMRRAHDADPLNHTVATARWFTEASAAQEYVATHAARITLPTLWQLPDADPIASTAVSLRVAEGAGGAKTVKRYPGLLHEIYNERPADRSVVLADLTTWIGAQLTR